MIIGNHCTHLDAAGDTHLRELARCYQLTVNIFAQAARALTLRYFSGKRNMFLGATTARHPVGMPEIQHTAGLFINSIPLCVRTPAAGQHCTVREWLNWPFECNLGLREHKHLSLVVIQESNELPKDQPLFDDPFVFENTPMEVPALDRA